jgi:hypothetical protein
MSRGRDMGRGVREEKSERGNIEVYSFFIYCFFEI